MSAAEQIDSATLRPLHIALHRDLRGRTLWPVAVENVVTGKRIAHFQERGGFSDRALAKVVLARWREIEVRLPIKDAAGLAVKVGQLKKGVLTWWLKHPAAIQALADALERSVGELDIREDQPAGSRIFTFDDLPDLRPIDLRAEPLCVLGQPDLFAVDWFALSTPTWIVAPSGAGKSLAARWHQARGTATMVVVARLFDAIGRLPDGPLVLDVQGADLATDRDGLRTLCQRKQILVLAPFLPPSDDDDDDDDEQAPKLDVVWPSRRSQLLSPRSGFTCDRWRPDASWLSTFLKWIADRQGLGDAWVERTLAWVKALDPDGSLFDTPGAVVPLLRFAWDTAPSRFRRSDFVAEWLSFTIAKVGPDRSPCSLWLQAHGRFLVERIIAARLSDTNLPWAGGLSRSEWAGLVPHDLAPRLSGDAVRRELAALTKAAPRRQQEAIERTAHKLERPSPEEAIQYLVTTRLLRPAGIDGLDLHPRWVVEWYAKAQALRVVQTSTSIAWGRWAVDEARRRHVDDALDDLAAADFKSVAKRVIEEWQPTSLGSAAAVESLFAAVARRLRRDETPLASAALVALWRLQDDLIQRRERWAPQRLTRPDPVGRPWPAPEGLACWWTWSFKVARPNVTIRDEDAWMVPGWARPSLATAPNWLPSIHIRDGLDRAEIERWQWLLPLARSVVNRCEDAQLPDRIPEFLFPEVLRAAPARGWRITRELARYLRYSEPTPSLALAALADLPEVEKTEIARGVWHAFMSGGEDRLYMLFEAGQVFEFVAQRVTEEDVREAVRTRNLTFPMLDPAGKNNTARLPIPLWEAALYELMAQGWLDADSHGIGEAWPRWTGAIVEAMIGGDLKTPAWLGIRRLWAVDPDRAYARALKAYPDDSDASTWIVEGWSRRREDILALIERHSLRPVPEWTRHWLSRHLADASGQQADRIFALLVAV